MSTTSSHHQPPIRPDAACPLLGKISPCRARRTPPDTRPGQRGAVRGRVRSDPMTTSPREHSQTGTRQRALRDTLPADRPSVVGAGRTDRRDGYRRPRRTGRRWRRVFASSAASSPRAAGPRRRSGRAARAGHAGAGRGSAPSRSPHRSAAPEKGAADRLGGVRLPRTRRLPGCRRCPAEDLIDRRDILEAWLEATWAHRLVIHLERLSSEPGDIAITPGG